MTSRSAARLLLVAFASAGACSGSREPLRFSAHTFESDSTAACRTEEPCAHVHLTWLQATGGTPRVARRLNEHVVALMRLRGEGDSASASPVAIADAFQREYAAHRAAASGRRERWSLMGAVSIPWRLERELLTLHAVTYAQAGGRYGLGQEWFSVVDERRGEPLTMRDIIADSVAAASIVERFFRRAKALPENGSLAVHGWTFPQDQFTLSPNIGLNDRGVVFHWNPRVIAPALSGATTLVVPYDSLQPALARGIAP